MTLWLLLFLLFQFAIWWVADIVHFYTLDFKNYRNIKGDSIDAK